MKVTLMYQGYAPNHIEPYMYLAVADNGTMDQLFEETYYGRQVTVDMPDYMWSDASGWVNVRCDVCEKEYWTRSSPGALVKCPKCYTEENLPLDMQVMEFIP